MNSHNRGRQLITTVLLCAALAAALSACGSGETAPEASVRPSASNEAQATPAPVSPGEQAATGTGRYVGQADPHTIEITVNDQPVAYQLGEEIRQAVEALQPGDEVTFEYEERAIEGDDSIKQLIITKIAKAK